MFCLEDTFHLINGENQLDEQTSQHNYLPFNEIKVNLHIFLVALPLKLRKRRRIISTWRNFESARGHKLKDLLQL